jgi:ankyrin repeat protein
MPSNDIHEFARIGQVNALRQAIQNDADIDLKDDFSTTALQYAIAYKQVEAVYALLELGGDVSSQDGDGSTALHYAIEHNLPEVLEALLQKCPEAVGISDKYGNQPLWTAAFHARGNYEMVIMLLKRGADPKHLNRVDLCPLDMPEKFQEPALLAVLESSWIHTD